MRSSRSDERYVFLGLTIVSNLLRIIALFLAIATIAHADVFEVNWDKSGLRQYNLEEFRRNNRDNLDDTKLINDAIEQIYRKGGGTLVFDGSRTYDIQRASVADPHGGIMLRPTVNMEGSNARLVLIASASWFYYEPDIIARAFIEDDVAVGDDSVVVDDASRFKVGDIVYYRAGEEKSDTEESSYFGWARVVGKNVNKLTLDVSFPRGLSLSKVSNKFNRSIIVIAEPLERLFIRNFRLSVGPRGNPEVGIYLKYGRNIIVDNIKAQDPGAGVIACQYCENVQVRNINIESSKDFGAASKGRGFSFAETKNALVEMVTASQLDNVLLFAEASSGVVMRNVRVENKNDSRLYVLLFSGQESSLQVSDMYVSGKGGFVLHSSGGSRGWFSIRNLEVEVSSDIVALGEPGSEITGRLLYRVAGRTEQYDLDRPHYSEVNIPIEDGMYVSSFFTPGLIGKMEIYKSSNVSVDDIKNITVALGRRSVKNMEGDAGINLTPFLTAGYSVIPNTTNGSNGGAMWQYRALPVTLLIATGRKGFTGARKAIKFKLISYPNALSER